MVVRVFTASIKMLAARAEQVLTYLSHPGSQGCDIDSCISFDTAVILCHLNASGCPRSVVGVQRIAGAIVILEINLSENLHIQSPSFRGVDVLFVGNEKRNIIPDNGLAPFMFLYLSDSSDKSRSEFVIIYGNIEVYATVPDGRLNIRIEV